VTCPYPEPNCSPPTKPDARRCACGRLLKRCGDCATTNRAFAQFCRACSAALPAGKANWPTYRGGSRRLGLNPLAPGADCRAREIGLTLNLGSECRSLLGYDGHLVAVSHDGMVVLADPAAAKSLCRFQTQGPITAQPCIHGGVLHLAARGQVSAYSLAAMTLDPPRVRPLWQVPLNGTPIHALTAAGNRLYVTVASPDWREIQVIDGIAGPQPAAPRPLHRAGKVSWVAADPEADHAVFLSEVEGHGVQLHLLHPELTTHFVALRLLAEHPIAFLSGTVFGVFGEGHRLYRINASTGAVDEPLEKDTQLFALGDDGAGEWDRDGVWIDSDGVSFARSGVRDSFQPYDRAVKGSPILVRDCAAVVGMEDGAVRIYYLDQLPRHEIWRVGNGSGVPITAIASFDSYIAAGNRDGVVELRELRGGGEPR
jgi:hypothetical protein